MTRFESGEPHFPEEILAEVVASYGGDYFTHHGSEGYEQEKEIDFIIRVAEETGMAAHTFHFKIRGRENWGAPSVATSTRSRRFAPAG